MGFGLALIASLWLAAAILIVHDQAAQTRQTQRDASNLALVFEQNVAHTIDDLDRIIKYLRWAYRNSPAGTAWSSIVSQPFAIARDTVLISVIDAHGMMITSNADHNPKLPVDLSDREHFRVHVTAAADNLFISKPLLGRVSGKWSVQFTRKLTDSEGRFAGVVVVSLDTAHLAHDYADLKLGLGGGLALVGDDGYVRAGSGVFADSLGLRLPAGIAAKASLADPQGAASGPTSSPQGCIAVARKVEDYPLTVVVAMPNVWSDTAWLGRRDLYVKTAATASLLAFLVMIGVAHRHHRYERRILYLARHDTLTGLANRQRLRDHLEQVFKVPAESRGYALHIIDLDRFKFVNDTYGHAVGDDMLRAVADRLRALTTPRDVLVRLGGDEFAILQSVAHFRPEAAALAERLCAVVAAPYELGHVRTVIGATVGIASAAADGDEPSELMKSADLALYAMKSAGRGNFRFYDPQMARAIQDRAIIENGLRAAIAQDQFALLYQPIVKLGSQSIVAYEALCDGSDPTTGRCRPQHSFPWPRTRD